MGIRGRKSTASLTVVSPAGIESSRRPKPPEELNQEQATEWLAVVNRLPADWFPRETQPMLALYCRHIVSARRVAQLIEAAESGESLDLEQYDRLLKMQERESRAISSLATRMRISQQSTYDKSRKKPLSAQKPWGKQAEDDEE
jgi:hypothetical protein